MAVWNPVQRSFAGGAWSQSLSARSDHPAYNESLLVMRNAIPRVSGSARRRPGTLYIASTKFPTALARLIPLIFDEENAYILELGHLYARFYKQDAQIQVLGVPVEIATPWEESELFDIQWAHDASTLILTHPDHQPRKIQRVDDVTWLISTLTFTYGPYLNRNEVEPNVLARQTGTIFPAKLQIAGVAVTWRGATGSRTVTADGDVFDATRDIGRLILIGDGEDDPAQPESFSLGRITAVASTVSATVEFFDGRVNEVPGGPQKVTLNWWMQAYYEGSAKFRWPSVCTFFQERLWLGGGETGSDLIYGSRIGAIDDFDLWGYSDIAPPATGDNTDQHTILDSSGISLELSYPEVHKLRWLRGSRNRLVAGTSRAVFVVTPPDNDGFTPLAALDVSPTAAAGSHNLAAAAISERLHFVAASRTKLTRIAFSLEADAFVPADMNLFNQDILEPGVSDITVAFVPDPIIWLALDDGRLVGCIVDESQKVVAWHDHTLGGIGVDQDYAEVESVSVIPSADRKYDQLWMVVRRTIGGVETRFIERMDRDLRAVDTITDQRFVDARGAAYSGVPTNSYTVGSHLIGETVDVLVDGGAGAPKIVDGAGAITLADPASDIVAGLPYTVAMTGLPIVIETRFGISFGKIHRASELVIRLIRSLGGRIGFGHPGSVQLHPIPYRQVADPLGSPPPLFTGVLIVPTVGEPSLEARIELTHASPVHFEIAAVSALLDIES